MTLPQPQQYASDDVDGQLQELTRLRNAVIGSRTKKAEFVVQGRVPHLVDLLATPATTQKAIQIRNLAATILGSLANSSSSATLLCLLRAGAPQALTTALAEVVCSTSMRDADRLKAIESLVRALRAIYVAIASEIAPSPRPGLGPARSSAGEIKAKSSREPVGWYGGSPDVKMASTSSSDLRSAYRDQSSGAASPVPSTPPSTHMQELILLGRSAIAHIFSPEMLPVVLGPLFIAPIPRHERAHETLRTAKAAPASRPDAPGLAATRLQDAETASVASSSRMDTDAGDGSSALRKQALTATEMVAGIVSSCLSIPGGDGSAASSSKAVGKSAFTSPEEEIAQRRRTLIHFSASDSPVRAIDFGPQEGEAELAPPLRDLLGVLLAAAECGFPKAQEAALWVLYELTRDNTEASSHLFHCSTPSGLISTSMLMALRHDPNVHVRLAAFSCMANLIKVHPFTSKTNERVLQVLVDLLEHPGEVQVSAAFGIAKVVADDARMQELACTTGHSGYHCIEKLGAMLHEAAAAILEAEGGKAGRRRPKSSGTTSSLAPATFPARSAEMCHRMHEAALTALAALSCTRDEIRRQVVDGSNPPLLPAISACLFSPSLGTRIAACRLVRALSRSISVLRTSLVDAGVSERLIDLVKEGGEEDEVRSEALGTLCNLVLSFSPMKQTLLEKGGLDCIVNLARSSTHGPTRLNALWVIKNTLYGSDLDLKRSVMSKVSFDVLESLARGPAEGASENDIDLQEQALNIVRNLASSQASDVAFTIEGFGGNERFYDMVEAVVWQRRSDLVTEQAAYILVNVATGDVGQRRALLRRSNCVDAVVYFARHPRVEVQAAGLWCAMNLTQSLAAAAAGAAAAPSTTTTSAGEGRGDDIEVDNGGGDSSQPFDAEREAISRLRRFGFFEALGPLIASPDADVKDRARALVGRFDPKPATSSAQPAAATTTSTSRAGGSATAASATAA